MTMYHPGMAGPAEKPKLRLFVPTLPKSEFRKFFSTNLWWGLLIPTVVLALGWSWIATTLVSFYIDQLNHVSQQTAGGMFGHVPDLPFASFALARSINITEIFPIVLGGLALSTELQRRTITTTYLTAPNRLSVLTAKFSFYGLVGLGYGVVITGISSLGIWLGAVTGGYTAYLPDAGVWLAMVGAGILSSMLWTLFSVGVGALIGNVVGTVLTLLLYTIVVENLLSLAFSQIAAHFPAFLINQSAGGMVSGIAADDLTSRIPDMPFELREPITQAMRYAAGAGGTYSWWIEGLIFLAWTLIFCGLGWFVGKRRDVS